MPDNYSITFDKDYFSIKEATGTTTPAEAINSVYNAYNIGNGQGFYFGKQGHNLLFKSLNAGNNITLQSTASGITINSTGGGGGSVTASNGLTKVGDDVQLGGSISGYTEINLGDDGILGIFSSNSSEGGGAIQVLNYGLLLNGGVTGAAAIELTNNGLRGSSGLGEVSLTGADVPIKLIGTATGGQVTSLVLSPSANTSTIKVESTNTIFRGIEYAGDYSTNFTNRSLVDRGYVTGNTASKSYVTGITSTLQTKSGFNSYTASTYGSYSFFKTGNYYAIHCPVAGNIIAASAFSANNLRSYPFVLTEDFSFNEILMTLGSQNVSSMRIGIYTDLAGEPDQLVANTDAGIYDGNAGVGGTNVSNTPAAVVTLPRGKYHLVYTCSGTPSVRSISTTALSTPLLGVTTPIGLNMASFIAGRTVARTFQALPTTFPAGSTAVTGSINVPYVVFKKA